MDVWRHSRAKTGLIAYSRMAFGWLDITLALSGVLCSCIEMLKCGHLANSMFRSYLLTRSQVSPSLRSSELIWASSNGESPSMTTSAVFVLDYPVMRNLEQETTELVKYWNFTLSGNKILRTLTELTIQSCILPESSHWNCKSGLSNDGNFVFLSNLLHDSMQTAKPRCLNCFSGFSMYCAT